MTTEADDTTNVENEIDDVKGLGRDTALLVIAILERLPGSFTKEAFRNELADELRNGSDWTGPNTGMQFARFENLTVPEVYQLTADGPIHISRDEEIPSWNNWINRYGRVLGRFGTLRILFVLTIITAISITTTWMDIAKWYRGTIRIHRTTAFWALAVTNLAIVVGGYVVLAETARISWDGITTAIIVAISPAALIKSVWFETPGGTKFGPGVYYHRLVRWAKDRFMVKHSKLGGRYVNVIAYFNSRDFLKDQVETLFNYTEPEHKALLQKELNEELEGATSVIERKRICARRLLNWYTWADLVERGCVPQRYTEEDQVRDPDSTMKQAVHYLQDAQVGSQRLDRYVRRRLADCSEDTKQHYERLVEDTLGEQSNLYMRVHFLYLTLSEHMDTDEDREALLARTQDTTETQSKGLSQGA